MPPNGKFKAVLFDMDETLIQHHRSGLELIAGVFSQFEDRLPGIEVQDFAQTLWGKANDMWYMMFDGVLTGDVARVYMFTNTLRMLEADMSLAEEMHEAFEQAMLDATRITPNAHEVLATLREAGFRTGIVTNGFTSSQTRKAVHHGLHDATEFFLPSESAGCHKPDPGIFEHALRLIDSDPREALFVGDNLEADIAGARGAGLQAVLFDPKGKKDKQLKNEVPDHEQPHHILTDLAQLLPIVGLG